MPVSPRIFLKCKHINTSIRSYSCPPTKPSGQYGCSNQIPGGNKRIEPPANCKTRPIAYNPCVPVFHHGEDTWKKYRFITFFVCLPLIIIQAFRALGHELPGKTTCKDYEYMRLRSKKFPWGDGNTSFFHNPHVNFLPGECEPPPLDCD